MNPMILIAASIATASFASQQASTQVVPSDRSQGFSVVLVLGDLQGGTTQDDVPGAARRALADMKDFLPYKSYRLLDVAWMLSTSSASSRLKGPDDQEYELNVKGVSAGSNRLTVTFVLREAGAHLFNTLEAAGFEAQQHALQQALESREHAERENAIRDEIAILERERAKAREKLGDKHPELLQAEERLKELKRQAELIALANRRKASSAKKFGLSSAIIDTRFDMEIGETVVVGTSRVRGGDKALIALLTAVPQRSGK